MKRSVLHRVMLAGTALCMVLSLMGCGAALQAVQQLREETPETQPGVQTGETGSKPAKPQAPGQPVPQVPAQPDPEAEPAQPEQPAPQGIGARDQSEFLHFDLQLPAGALPHSRRRLPGVCG